MFSKKLPCCYIPSRVIAVDDKRSYLDILESELRDSFCVSSFDDPKEALHFFEDAFKESSYLDRCITYEEDQDFDASKSKVNLTNLWHEVYNPDRFNEISVLIADYDMPIVDGIELFSTLKEKQFKKLLLTGEAGHDLAVNAFNNGVIDKFVLKKEKNIFDTLTNEISELQVDYFCEHSNVMINPLKKGELYKLQCLEDKKFIDFFNQLIDENGIVEFYLVDPNGSLLMLDENGVPSWLAVCPMEAYKDYIETASFHNDVPTEVTEMLAGTHVPFFFTDEDYSTAPKDWAPYLHEATLLEGDPTKYYVAHITNTGPYKIDKKKILSLKEYLQENN